MLHLAVKASLPVVTISTSDCLNMVEVVKFITGKPPIPYNLKEKVLGERLYFMYDNPEYKRSVYDTAYEVMADVTSTLLVVNPKKPSSVFFDAGELPTPRLMVSKLLQSVFPDEGMVNALMPTLGGLTLKDVGEAVRITMARDNSLTPAGIMTTRKQCFRGSKGVTLITTDQVHYDPPEFLLDWVKKEKPFFLSGTDNRLVSRGLLFDGLPGCQPAGSLVLMSDGTFKKVENVKAGDWVKSPQKNGDVVDSQVVSTQSHDNQRIMKVSSKGGQYLCSWNHILPLSTLHAPRGMWSNKRVQQKRVVEVTCDEFLSRGKVFRTKSKLFTSPAIELPASYLPVHPYILGVVLGDACISNDTVRLSTPEVELLQRLMDLGVEFGSPNQKKGQEDKDLVNVNIIKGVASEVRKLPVWGCTSHTKFIPDEYKKSSIQQRLELMAGLMDTDGEYCGAYSTTSLRLAEDIKWVAQSLGWRATISARTTKCNGKTFPSYRMFLSFAELTPPCQVSRKRREPRDMDWKNPRNQAVTVEEVGVAKVYGFTLDSQSQWYVTDDWIVTHNTGKTAGAKFIAQQFGVPLFRVDIGGAKSKWVGESESGLEAALAQLDQEAPCIALFDEIEKIFANSYSDSSGVTTSMLSKLLWWLAERETRVLAVMTCNKKSAIPPELYREGRIDKVMVFHGFTEHSDAMAFAGFVLEGFPAVDKAGDSPIAKALSDKITAMFKTVKSEGKSQLSHAAIHEAVVESIKDCTTFS